MPCRSSLPGGEGPGERETIVFMRGDVYRGPQNFNEPNRFDIHPRKARKRLAIGCGVRSLLVQAGTRALK